MANKIEVALSMIDEITSPLNRVVNNMEAFNSRIGKIFAFAGVAGGVAVLSGSINKVINNSLQLADQLDKTSKSLGMSAEEVQKWDLIAGDAGTSIEKLSNGMMVLSKNAYEAHKGNKAASLAFKDLGLSIYDTNGNLKNQSQLFEESLLAISAIENSTKRAAVAQSLFGKAGKELIPLLSQGSTELQKQIEEVKNYGGVLSNETVKALDDAGDKMERFKKSTAVLGAEFTSAFIPALTKGTDVLSKFVSKLHKMWEGPSEQEKAKEKLASLQSELETINNALQFSKNAGNTFVGALGQPVAVVEERVRKLRIEIAGLVGAQRHKTTGFVNPSAPTGAAETPGGNKPGGRKASTVQGPENGPELPEYLKGNDALAKNILSFAEFKQRAIEKSNEQILYSEEILNNARIASMESEGERELALLKQRYDEIRKAHADNSEALKNIDQAYEIDRTRIEREQSNKRVDAARRESLEKTETVIGYSRNFISALSDSITAMRGNAKVTKGVRIGEAIMDSAAAGIAAARTIWSSSKSWQEALVATIATEALLTAQLVPQIAKIKSASFASGGTSIGGWARVGEQGPEDAFFPAGTQIYNAHQSKVNNNQSTTLIANFYDQSGNFTQQFQAKMRSGELDNVISDLKRKIAA